MLAAVLKDYNKLELQDVPDPQPDVGEVVVRIKLSDIAKAVDMMGQPIRNKVMVHP